MTQHQLEDAVRDLFLAGGHVYGVLSDQALTDPAVADALADWRKAVEQHIHPHDPPRRTLHAVS
jgi:hypothetical protein